MKRNWLQIIILAWVIFWALENHAYGQTACTATNPCVPVSVAGVTGNTVTLLKCGGTCTSATLNAYLANPTAQSVWSVAGTFSQYAATAIYNDPEAYGLLLSYAAYETPSGGTAGPVSAIITFQVPAAPQTPPTLNAGPALVTTGASGVQ